MSDTVKRVRLDRPLPVWVQLMGRSWEPLVDVPALLLEWEGRGLPGRREWKGRITIDPADATDAWNPRWPWYDAKLLRPREV